MESTSRTEFRVLGPLSVLRDGRAVALPSGKSTALLASLLLDAPRTVSTRHLVDALWGECPPRSAVNALQVHVSTLRRALREGGVPESVTWTGNGYAIEIDAQQLDLHQLSELRQEALRVAAAGDTARAADLLAQALALWHGDALDGVGGVRLTSEAARLDDLRIATMEERIDAELAAGRCLEVVDELERLVAAHPFRERLRRLLMLALYQSGRQADALAVYRDARRVLREELGMHPSPELQELERRVLRHDDSLRIAPPLILREPGASPRRMTVTAAAFDLRVDGELDPEAWERVLERPLAAVTKAVERRGGEVQASGGGVLACVFGSEGPREDHAWRAARAALDARKALRAVAGRVELRVGIETGVVVVRPGRGRGSLLGALPADATRLAVQARAWEIVFGENARSAAEARVDVEPGPTPGTFVVRDASVTRRGRVGGEARFRGRSVEQRVLRAAYRSVVATGRARTVTIVGEPGIGKTRLADEAARRLGARVARGRCPEDGTHRTYWPLRESLEDLGLLDPKALAALLEHEPGGLRAARVVAETLGLAPPSPGAEERPWAVAQLFRAIAKSAPLVVIVDDAHWAEGPLLDVLSQLPERCTNAPVLVLCTGRPGLLESRPDWREGALELAPLPHRDCARIAADVLAKGPGDPEDVARIAQGNPLVATELAALVRDRGKPDPLPTSVEALLAARLDDLQPLEREVVDRASVEGYTFHAGAVADLCREDEPRLRETLLELVRKDVLRPTRPVIGGREAFRFRHVLVREAAYAALPKALRAELHEMYADWLELELGGDLTGWEELAGTHFESSVHLRTGIGATDGRVTPLALRAGELLATAALRAEAGEDDAAATALFGRALALLPVTHPQRVEHAWRATIGLVLLGRLDDAIAWATDRAKELTRAGLDEEAAVMQLAVLTAVVFAGGEAPSSLGTAMRTAAPAVRRIGGPFVGAYLEGSIGWGHYQRCELARFIARFERAGEISRRAGNRRNREVAQAWVAIGLVRGRCPVPEAIERCEALIAGGEVTRALEAQVKLALAELHAMAGRRAIARALLDESTTLIEDLRLDWIGAKLCGHRATVELLLGERETARARLVAGYEGFAALGAASHGARFAARLAALAADDGRIDEALSYATTSRESALSDDLLARVGSLAAEARVQARVGDVEGALRLAREAAHAARRVDEPVLRAGVWEARAVAESVAGHAGRARAACTAALQEFERKGHVVFARRARRQLDSLARA